MFNITLYYSSKTKLITDSLILMILAGLICSWYYLPPQYFQILMIIGCISIVGLNVITGIFLSDAVNAINFLDENFSYIRYNPRNHTLLMSRYFTHLIQHHDCNLTTLEELSHVIKDEDINLIYRYLELVQKTREIKKIPYIALTINNKTIYYRLEISALAPKGSVTFVLMNLFNVTNEQKQHHAQTEQINKLQQEHTLYQYILNHIPVAIWMRDNDLNITYYNKHYLYIISNDKNEILQENLEIDKHAITYAQKAKESGQVQNEERHIIIKGKRYLYQFNDIYDMTNDYSLTVAFDVSSKDHIQSDLARNIAAQSDLLESTSNACAIFGPDRKLKFYNHAFVKLWELDENWLDEQPLYEQVLDKLYYVRKLPEQANFLKFKKDQMNLFTNLTEILNDFFYLPDGRSLRVIVIPHSFGGLLFSYEDMTDRIALESSYNTLIAVQKATLDNLHEGICVFGENGRLKLSNPTFAKMWQLSTDYLNSKPHLTELIDAVGHFVSDFETLNFHRDNLLTVFNKRTSLQEKIERTDGSVISRVVVPLPDGATLLTDLDMTDSVVVERSLREKNTALQDADRIKSEFLANVSYELRSPLTSIVGLTESLYRNFFGKLNEKQSEYVYDILNSSKQLMHLINDIIDLTSVDAGYIELNISEFDVYESINNILLLVKERIKSYQISCIINCMTEESKMIGDEIRIKQVIFKLLSNAIEYSHKKGIIEVTIESDYDSIYINVSDNGRGISEDEKPYIFDKFFQTQHPKNTGKSGTGLGLSIVKTFVELHGGDVSFESRENHGTSFRCKLPKQNPELLSLYRSGHGKELSIA